MAPLVEFSGAIVGTLIFAMGLTAWGLAALGLSSGDRAPVWFGLFAVLYGVRLAVQSPLFEPALEGVSLRVGAFITYVIIVPAGLFVEAIFGPGWRHSLRRAWQGAAVCAGIAIAYDLASGEPGAALWLNAPVVLTAGGIAAAHAIAGWRRAIWPRELRVAVLGGLVFAAVATYQTLGGALPLEPVGMLVFVTSVGYVVVRRMLAGERRLVAVSRELELARQIQQSILPRTPPRVPGVRVAARYLPMSDVGGDFYDFEAQRGSGLGVIVADVSGHGVPAALVASMVKVAFASEADRIDEPGEALASINRTLCDCFEGAFVTACCGHVDPRERRLRYATAGHPPPLLRRRGGAVRRLEERGLLLAFDAEARYSTAEVRLEAGDRLLLYSDGLVEACDARDQPFGEARLERLLAAGDAAPPEELLESVVAELQRWVGSGRSPQDDVTVVVLDVEGG